MIPSRETEEKRRHSTALIPYSYYECRLPEEFMNVPMHWHNEFELNYILRGRGEFICDNRRFEAGEGDILILPPNMLHAAYPYRDSELIYHALVFNPIMLGANSNDRCSSECIRPVINGTRKLDVYIPREAGDYPGIKEAVSRIFSCAHSNQARMDLLLKSELLRLFWLLEGDEDRIYRQDNGISYSGIVRPALEYMAENFREDITISQLAELVHLSKSHFMNCFKKAVGIGAIEHLTQLRINAACEALTATEKKIAEIAFDCGYNNLSNFNRHFLNMVGCTPNEYRRHNTSVNQPEK